jgi:hypothetical protein
VENQITPIFMAIPDKDLPSRHSSEYVKFSQSDLFFKLAAAKQVRMANLADKFRPTGVTKVYLSANLSGFECCLQGFEVSTLESGFFTDLDFQRRAANKQKLAGSVVIINNNDAGAPEARIAYSEFYNECLSTVFIGWDWDNHHWLDLSTFLAAHSDVYAPAHHENLYLLSRYNWHLAGPVYCSSVQWSRRFLTENLGYVLQAERSDQPLGMHIPYAQFTFRMQVISTLNQHYPSIGFSSRTFHQRTPMDKLQEWCGHKTHWIAPVLNDVPIRIFDALITGGIPLIPESMRLLPPIAVIPRDYVVFYGPADIVNPIALVEKANRQFDQGGRDQMVARHRYALEKHHGDVSIRSMLAAVIELLNIP